MGKGNVVSNCIYAPEGSALECNNAGLVLRNLSFRDIFSVNLFLCSLFILMLRDCFSAFVNNLNYDKFIPNNT